MDGWGTHGAVALLVLVAIVGCVHSWELHGLTVNLILLQEKKVTLIWCFASDTVDLGHQALQNSSGSACGIGRD